MHNISLDQLRLYFKQKELKLHSTFLRKSLREAKLKLLSEIYKELIMGNNNAKQI